MPIYDYRCTSCHREFEALCRTPSTDDVRCPHCNSARPSRLISRFAVSRNLTPCGTPAGDAGPGCSFNASRGGCGCCQMDA